MRAGCKHGLSYGVDRSSTTRGLWEGSVELARALLPFQCHIVPSWLGRLRRVLSPRSVGLFSRFFFFCSAGDVWHPGWSPQIPEHLSVSSSWPIALSLGEDRHCCLKSRALFGHMVAGLSTQSGIFAFLGASHRYVLRRACMFSVYDCLTATLLTKSASLWNKGALLMSSRYWVSGVDFVALSTFELLQNQLY